MKSHKKYVRVRQKRSKKKFLLILLAGVLLLVGIIAALEFTNNINLFSKPTATKTTADKPNDGNINFSPPTEEEKQSGNEQKEEIVQKEQQQTTPPPSTPSNRKSVKPFIVSASAVGGEIDVRGFVSGVFEEGGTCTARFTKAKARDVVKTSPGFEDFNKTTCQPFIFPQSELSGGGAGWSVTISYLSKTAEGVSDTIPVTVQ